MRFIRANRLEISRIAPSNLVVPSTEILIVCAGADLEMLPHVIPAAVKSVVGGGSPKVTVIVPEIDFPKCSQVLSEMPDVNIVNEDEIFSQEIINTLRVRFGSRFGWVLQQFLKVKYVSNSTLSGVLVVDADTILLEPRTWVDLEGNQILTPSDEYNYSYYEFLYSRNLSPLRPRYTFVSHHMLFQPILLTKALYHGGWSSVEELIDDVVQSNFSSETSPFSIDYELYAQFVYMNFPEKIRITKWSNIAIQRVGSLSPQIAKESVQYKDDFSSISFHSYL
jgi:hypothetical protein